MHACMPLTPCHPCNGCRASALGQVWGKLRVDAGEFATPRVQRSSGRGDPPVNPPAPQVHTPEECGAGSGCMCVGTMTSLRAGRGAPLRVRAGHAPVRLSEALFCSGRVVGLGCRYGDGRSEVCIDGYLVRGHGMGWDLGEGFSYAACTWARGGSRSLRNCHHRPSPPPAGG